MKHGDGVIVKTGFNERVAEYISNNRLNNAMFAELVGVHKSTVTYWNRGFMPRANFFENLTNPELLDFIDFRETLHDNVHDILTRYDHVSIASEAIGLSPTTLRLYSSAMNRRYVHNEIKAFANAADVTMYDILYKKGCVHNMDKNDGFFFADELREARLMGNHSHKDVDVYMRWNAGSCAYYETVGNDWNKLPFKPSAAFDVIEKVRAMPPVIKQTGNESLHYILEKQWHDEQELYIFHTKQLLDLYASNMTEHPSYLNYILYLIESTTSELRRKNGYKELDVPTNGDA